VFKFDVEIQGNIRPIYFIASLIWACEILFDLDSQSSIFLPIFQLVEFKIFLLKSLNVVFDTYKDST